MMHGLHAAPAWPRHGAIKGHEHMRHFKRTTGVIATAVTASFLMGGCAAAQDKPVATASSNAPAPAPDSKLEQTADKAGEIASQPARDVGLVKTEVPPILVAASQAPYSLEGVKTCQQLASAVQALNEVLGADFAPGDEKEENRAGKIAEAGGKTIVNAILPFRGLVRELTGAAPAERRLNAAIDAGFARRGFLRGVHRTRGCRTKL
jgi:hypothetical protein